MAYSKEVFSENSKTELNFLCHEAEVQSWCTPQMLSGMTDVYLSRNTSWDREEVKEKQQYKLLTHSYVPGVL